MSGIRIALATSFILLVSSEFIAARKGLMKGVGGANAAATEMLDGKAPFEANKAKALLATMSDNAAKMPPLFPDNSKTGGETTVVPAIWENKADFDAKMAKFSADAKAAAGKVTDLASFKGAMGEVRQNCGGCHKAYRKPS